MNPEQYIKLGKITALCSFLIGTGIFGLYFLSSASELLFVGYGFILLAAIVNIGILALIIVKAIKYKMKRRKLFATSGLMLMNIPIMLCYCWVATILMNTMRITFNNKTGTTITDINILGCEKKHIDKLDPDQSKTCWLAITGDCSIDINYIINGQRKEEDVAGYVTNDNGQKVDYNIGRINSQKQ